MSVKGRAYLAGAYEHPTRKAEDKSVAQLRREARPKLQLKNCGLVRMAGMYDFKRQDFTPEGKGLDSTVVPREYDCAACG